MKPIETGRDLKVWAQEQWNTLVERTGAGKMVDSIKLAFSNLSDEDRLNLDVKLKGNIHKIDLQEYFSLSSQVKDEGGMIFNHLMDQLEAKTADEIRELLPEQGTWSTDKLKKEQKERFLQIINDKFPIKTKKSFLTQYPTDYNIAGLRQELQGR